MCWLIFTTFCLFIQIVTKNIDVWTIYFSPFALPIHGEVYSIQHYVVKFVSDLRQVDGFLWVLRFLSTNKTDYHDITEILLKVALNTITILLSIIHLIWIWAASITYILLHTCTSVSKYFK